ncbi:ABC-type transport system involved in multi-copper enzyme maturation, permease component [Geodermatophilus africanus]|uniref:ABC-type transport system involved in multi-copper enzyme maturation, permease component n=1 Tax=Geodermatophilus africanus TaxID=1137993 RepID=A0A1H3LB82_9ACTN|nr:ABC transporter permease [Geodermatophilus africanus]SDY61651.1 ABC-type transport system involved in multi-copper enzyme maturation, permease component [Geodermatophilus africanus]
MTALIRSTRGELLRLYRWPALWVLAATWLTLNVVFGYVFDYIAYRTGDSAGPNTGVPGEELLAGVLPDAVPAVLVQGMPMFGGAILMILGALAAGSGYGWGTWKTVLTQGPSRPAAVGGTVMALATVVLGVVLGTAAVDLGVSNALALAESRPVDLPPAGELLEAVSVGLLVLGMWTTAGMLLGSLARSPALAVGLGLVWALVVENLLRGVSGLLGGLAVVTDHLPGTAAGSLVGALGASGQSGGAPGVLTILPGTTALAALATYFVAFTAATLLLIRRRDLA